MVEIHPGLFVGNQDDYEQEVRHQQGWAVIHACKEPYHRKALCYSTRAVSKTHPEYLIARRGDRLILNLIDSNDPKYIPSIILDEAVNFIDLQLTAGKLVLVHCNQGQSRGPSLAMIFMRRRTSRLSAEFSEALKQFEAVYPLFSPALGFRIVLEREWLNGRNGVHSES